MISVLVEHVSLLAELIKPLCKHVIVLTGSASAKEKHEIELSLKSVLPTEPMVIVASLKYISEVGCPICCANTLHISLI